jgi:hypothetical protein
MQSEEWSNDLNTGDVLQNKVTGQTWTVASTELEDEGFIILSKTLLAQNPEEWERRRKTVDAG